MIVEKDQFPITIQAYELNGDVETFVAEQVVNSQADVDAFANRYTGKLIKAKVTPVNTTNHTVNTATTTAYKKKSSSGTAILIILIILIILVAIGWYTGWIQRTFGINS